MIDALYIVAEDAVRAKKAGQSVVEGQPLTLNSNGELIGATAGTKVFGLSKLDSNQYRDFAFGEVGAFGTQRLTVVQKGTCRVKDSTYNGPIEIDTSMGPTSTPVTVQVLAGVTFAVDQLVYADGSGLISNVGATGQQPFGRVTATQTMTGGWLEIEVDALGLAA